MYIVNSLFREQIVKSGVCGSPWSKGYIRTYNQSSRVSFKIIRCLRLNGYDIILSFIAEVLLWLHIHQQLIYLAFDIQGDTISQCESKRIQCHRRETLAFSNKVHLWCSHSQKSVYEYISMNKKFSDELLLE